MSDNADWKKYRSILCLNGKLPARTFFENLNLPVIAADGAANTLHESGIKPSIIIGDLDSVHDYVRENNKVHHSPDQNFTDFHKSLQYMQQNELLPAIIVGINGGYLDHILNNVNIFLETDADCLLYDPPMFGCVLNHGARKEWSLPLQTKISFIGIPSATVTSRGLKWDLQQKKLQFPGMNSCFNRTAEQSISVEIHEGAVLVLIYMESIKDAGM